MVAQLVIGGLVMAMGRLVLRGIGWIQRLDIHASQTHYITLPTVALFLSKGRQASEHVPDHANHP